jgi:hypothetical protein
MLKKCDIIERKCIIFEHQTFKTIFLNILKSENCIYGTIVTITEQNIISSWILF